MRSKISLLNCCMSPLLWFCVYRNSAEDAIQRLTGVVIGSQKVRLSWGRSPGNKQVNFLNVVQSPLPMSNNRTLGGVVVS